MALLPDLLHLRALRACVMSFAMLVLAPPASSRAQEAQPQGFIAQGYLYIEPYEARFEALFDVATMRGWLGEGADAPATLDEAAQLALANKAAALAAKWCSLRENEVTVRAGDPTCSIVKGKPGNTLPAQPGEVLVAADCMVGLTWSFTISAAPLAIEAQWEDFRAPVDALPVRIFFGTQSETAKPNARLPTVKWINNNRLPYPTGISPVPGIPPPEFINIPVASLIWLVIGYIYFLIRNGTDRKPRGGWTGMVMAWLFGAAVLLPMNSVQVPHPFGTTLEPVTTPAAATRIVEPLLRNAYRAFDYRAETQIYDTLARSVHGELLRKLYLDTIEALSIDGREGARVRVTEFSAEFTKVEPGKDNAFTAEGQWTTLGEVGHWGHNHPRVNRYRAKVTAQPVETEWKITAIEVLELRRL